MRQLQLLRRMASMKDISKLGTLEKAVSSMRNIIHRPNTGRENVSSLRKTFATTELNVQNFDKRMNTVKQLSETFPVRAFGHFRDMSQRSLTILERCIYLKGSSMFRDLHDEQVAMVAQLAETKSFGRDEIIYSVDDPADSIYFIIDGEVEIEYKGLVNDKSQVVQYNTGALFGESSFLRASLHVGAAKCVVPTHVLILPTADLTDLALQYRPILRVILSSLSREALGWIAKYSGGVSNPPSIAPFKTSPELSSLRRRYRASSQ